MMTVFKISDTCQSDRVLQLNKKIRRGPKLEGCAFANFGNSSGTEGEPSQRKEIKMRAKRGKNQCCRDGESNPGPVDN